MLVFRRGTWQQIEVPFSDPMLTEGHKAAAAALIANGLSVAQAEEKMYAGSLGISREQHNSPQNEKK